MDDFDSWEWQMKVVTATVAATDYNIPNLNLARITEYYMKYLDLKEINKEEEYHFN